MPAANIYALRIQLVSGSALREPHRRSAHDSTLDSAAALCNCVILPRIMFIQGQGTAERTYDAIVVGSGISGGWAAKELTEKGLRTLVLERGRDVKHPDYPTAMLESWQFPGRSRLPQGRAREAGEAEPHRLHDAPGVGALVRQRRREPVQRSEAVRLDARLSRRRTVAPVGPAVVPLERPRLRGERQGRPRRRLADSLQGHRAVVRLRRALRRHQRQPRRPAAAARRPVPAADGDELPRRCRSRSGSRRRSAAAR